MRILFVLVLYKCCLKDSQSISSITNSLEKAGLGAGLFIFDNSPEAQSIPTNMSSNWEEITYYHAPENPGLGVAYNKGATFAKSRGYEWITLLDQDSTFEPNFIQALSVGITKYPHIGLFVPQFFLTNDTPFSPIRYRCKRGKALPMTPGQYSLHKFVPINSGMTILVENFLAVGGYNPEIWLDFADFQFIEKYRKIFDKMVLISAKAYQQFSNEETDIQKIKHRFKIYCECAQRCKKETFFDHICYFYVVLRHTLGLCLKSRNITFMKIFLQIYLLEKH